MLNRDYKNNNGRNFQITKFSFIDFVLTERKSLSGKRPNRPMANLPVVDFHVCWDGFSQGQKSLYNIVVYVINHILLPLSIIFYHNIDVK